MVSFWEIVGDVDSPLGGAIRLGDKTPCPK